MKQHSIKTLPVGRYGIMGGVIVGLRNLATRALAAAARLHQGAVGPPAVKRRVNFEWKAARVEAANATFIQLNKRIQRQ